MKYHLCPCEPGRSLLCLQCQNCADLSCRRMCMCKAGHAVPTQLPLLSTLDGPGNNGPCIIKCCGHCEANMCLGCCYALVAFEVACEMPGKTLRNCAKTAHTGTPKHLSHCIDPLSVLQRFLRNWLTRSKFTMVLVPGRIEAGRSDNSGTRITLQVQAGHHAL